MNAELDARKAYDKYEDASRGLLSVPHAEDQRSAAGIEAIADAARL